MGLQKYRADWRGVGQVDGGQPWYTNWLGGTTLSLIRDCLCVNAPSIPPRTVYVQDQDNPLQAACFYKGTTLRGVVVRDPYVHNGALKLHLCEASLGLLQDLQGLTARRKSRAGCLALTRTPSGIEVGIYRSKDAGLDTILPFYTVCETHGQLIGHRTLADARAHLMEPDQWCSVCSGQEAYEEL